MAVSLLPNDDFSGACRSGSQGCRRRSRSWPAFDLKDRPFLDGGVRCLGIPGPARLDPWRARRPGGHHVRPRLHRPWARAGHDLLLRPTKHRARRTSGNSAEVSATTPKAVAAPINVKAVSDGTTMELTWDAVPGATRYDVIQVVLPDDDEVVLASTAGRRHRRPVKWVRTSSSPPRSRRSTRLSRSTTATWSPSWTGSPSAKRRSAAALITRSTRCTACPRASTCSRRSTEARASQL